MVADGQRDTLDEVRIAFGARLDIVAAFGAGEQQRPAGGSIEHHRSVERLCGVDGFFHVDLFFFKQKTAYELGLGIPAEPLFRSGNLFLIVQLHFSKLFLILKSGVNHTSRGSISTSTLPSIKLRKCSSKIITSILSFISGRLA